ncbi:MAG: DciA family protein [Marinibacterium sp.]|nr:DciA family protein [Marinibacterium sp.]
MARRHSTTRGFKRTSVLLKDRIREAGESRGFAVSRVLTHWAEIAGPDMAAQARPVDVSYGRGGFGATLTVLTTGPNAPLLEMQKEQLREKVNAAYGYAAIKRIRITQTAPTGFAEGQAVFAGPKPRSDAPPDPQVTQAARDRASGVADDGLRSALERLGRNILSKPNR